MPGMTQVLGTTRRWQVTATRNRQPMTNTFTSADALSASVWPGEDIAPVLAPTVSWIDAAAGTIQLVITAAQLTSAAVDPGVYQIRVTVTPQGDGEPRDVHYGEIEFLPTDGSRSLPASLITHVDLLTWCSEVAKIRNPENDLAGFADQRHRAMTVFTQEVLRRYCPRPGGSRRYMALDGSGPGPYLRYAPSPDGTPPPTRGQVEAWLTPQRIVLNEDVVEANARLAASIIYGTTPGQNSVYQQMARDERRLAAVAIQRSRVELDTTATPDGIPEIRVDRDVVYLT